MKAVIAGGTGFLGSALAASLRDDGHAVTIVTRRPRGHDQVSWTDLSVFDGADAVINLAGESLEAARWTAARKHSILESRITATETIVKAISAAAQPPAVLINASAVGIYGAHRDEALTEESPVGSDFLASVCTAWEAAAMAAAWTTRVVLLRSGLVLDRHAGALPKLVRPFQFFAGGPIGSGDQYWSWIHHEDWTRMVRWTIDMRDVAGPLNATAPAPVTNRDLARSVGRAVHRPALMPAPSFAVRLILGEMADAMILNGQRVLPAKATRHGFQFRYPHLDAALQQIYRTA